MMMAGISSKALNFGEPKNKEKTFQGQRFDDELGLNWVQFKWRNHDPQIGRFIEIDPLSEDYEYNSTYAFSENKVTTHIELEGLEAIPLPALGIGGTIATGVAELTPFGLGVYAVYEYGQFAATHPEVAEAASKGSTPLSAQVATSRYLQSVQAKEESINSGAVIAIDFVNKVQSFLKAEQAKPQVNTKPNTQTGSIYKVPGSATKSGKPYIGRHNKPNPDKTRKSRDGRDRTQAQVIDTYDPIDVHTGRKNEQGAIDDHGGVENLDNKRNEIKKDKIKSDGR